MPTSKFPLLVLKVLKCTLLLTSARMWIFPVYRNKDRTACSVTPPPPPRWIACHLDGDEIAMIVAKWALKGHRHKSALSHPLNTREMTTSAHVALFKQMLVFFTDSKLVVTSERLCCECKLYEKAVLLFANKVEEPGCCFRCDRGGFDVPRFHTHVVQGIRAVRHVMLWGGVAV